MTVSVYVAVLSRSRLVTFTKITPVVELMSKLGSPPRGSFPDTIKYVTGSLSPRSWSLASTWITLSPWESGREGGREREGERGREGREGRERGREGGREGGGEERDRWGVN